MVPAEQMQDANPLSAPVCTVIAALKLAIVFCAFKNDLVISCIELPGKKMTQGVPRLFTARFL